jgi:hypothetical protein
MGKEAGVDPRKQAFHSFVAVFAIAGCGDRGDLDTTAQTESAVTDRFSDAAFQQAAKCPRCTILHKANLYLPETGASAVSAKILDTSDMVRVVTLAADGRVVDESDLLATEHEAEQARYGSPFNVPPV